jgi:hypothetical protein
VHEDVHEEEGPSPGDCFGAGCDSPVTTNDDGDSSDSSKEDMLQILTVIAFVAIVFLSLSIRKDRLGNKNLDSVQMNEDE